MNTNQEETKEVTEAILQVFTVLQMFNFKAGCDIRLGSFMHMFEEAGASSGTVDLAIGSMFKANWLISNIAQEVRPGGHTLTAEGFARMEELLG